jgi:hypothetical protein
MVMIFSFALPSSKFIFTSISCSAMFSTDELSATLRSTNEILSKLRIFPEKKKKGTRKYKQLNRPSVISSEEWIELEKMDQMEREAKERTKELNKIKRLQRKKEKSEIEGRKKYSRRPAKRQPARKQKPESEGSEIDDNLEAIDENVEKGT